MENEMENILLLWRLYNQFRFLPMIKAKLSGVSTSPSLFAFNYHPLPFSVFLFSWLGFGYEVSSLMSILFILSVYPDLHLLSSFPSFLRNLTGPIAVLTCSFKCDDRIVNISFTYCFIRVAGSSCRT